MRAEQNGNVGLDTRDLLDRIVAGTIVNDDDVKISKSLTFDGLNRVPHERGMIVYGDDDGYPRHDNLRRAAARYGQTCGVSSRLTASSIARESRGFDARNAVRILPLSSRRTPW